MKAPEPSNIPDLIKRIDKLLLAVDEARGTAGQLIKAAPLEIRLYNITTGMKNELSYFHAMLEDAQGIYMKEDYGNKDK